MGLKAIEKERLPMMILAARVASTVQSAATPSVQLPCLSGGEIVIIATSTCCLKVEKSFAISDKKIGV
uniref:Uncharacterized protein n=1 Tax=Parascaris equorum TaxID=6256 RepID=A0A914S6I0_PAREQ